MTRPTLRFRAPLMERIVLVGAGQAAAQAVATLRTQGFAGSLTLVGREPVPPYQRPPLSKAYLSGEFALERLLLKPAAFYAEAQCETMLGVEALAIDRARRQARLSDGRVLRYDKLLLATGARVRTLDVPGAGLRGIHYLRSLDDADRLAAGLSRASRLAVVGGGYVGLEVAAVARRRGLDVTVFEAGDRLMGRTVSPAVSSFYAEAHRAAGVRIETGATVEAFEGTGTVEAVRTGRGSRPADLVLAGIGAVPNCELAAAAGLPCDDGIVVDPFCATADPAIFAAGDCTRHIGREGGAIRLESVQNAIDQAKHAAMAMLGRPTPYREIPWFWSDQYDLKLQIAGLARPDDRIVLRGDPAARSFAVYHLRDEAVAAVEAVNAAPDYIVGRRLIAERRRVSPERLADPSAALKDLL